MAETSVVEKKAVELLLELCSHQQQSAQELIDLFEKNSLFKNNKAVNKIKIVKQLTIIINNVRDIRITIQNTVKNDCKYFHLIYYAQLQKILDGFSLIQKIYHSLTENKCFVNENGKLIYINGVFNSQF
ncbi:MAG: hypothetical protein V1773_06435 [bacterium]